MSLLTGEGFGGGGFSSKMVDANGQPVKMWNYTKAADDNGVARADYSQSITGTVIDMDEVQATKFQSTELEWWDDAKTKPKMDIEIVIHRDDINEDVCWHIKPGSSINYDKFSAARKACIDAIRAATGDAETKDITKLCGFNVTIATNECVLADGRVVSYSQGNPRPWSVKINGEGNKDLVRFGKPKPKPQSNLQPQPQQPVAQAQPQIAVEAAKQAQATMQAQQAPVQPQANPANADAYGQEIPF